MTSNIWGVGPQIVTFSVLTLVLVQYWIKRQRIPKGLRLPPGPPGKFLLGNVSDMPSQYLWETFSRWGKEYGDIFYVNVLGQAMVVINSRDVANDLFEKSSSIYSDRAEFPMLNDLMGFDWLFAFMRYGEYWRRHRRIFHLKFHPNVVANYHEIQTRQTRKLLPRFRDTPEDFVEHLRFSSGAIIMEIVYGIKVLPKNDRYLEAAEKGMSALTVAGNPGTFLVDMLPILKYIPPWFPGAGFRKQANIWRQVTAEMSNAPFNAVKNAMKTGTAGPSLTASCLEEAWSDPDTPPDEEDVIRGTGSTAYAAGSDSAVSALHTFMLAMVVSPEAQKKAQAELDSVVGPYRLPEFGDRESLPYINAVCKEVLRWQPVAPLGVAHRVTQDDIYRDYFIPKGAIIVGNIWKMLHDEETYGPDTDKFKPERFLGPDVKAPNSVWGFGRRMCPGRFLVDNSLFMTVVSILHVFDIDIARDSDGKEIPVKAAFTSGFMSHPKDFQCAIRPRSEAAARLILDLDKE